MQGTTRRRKKTRDKKSVHARALQLERCGYFIFLGSALLVSFVVFFIILFLGRQGLLVFAQVSPWQFFFSSDWSPPERFGALTFIVGSISTTLLAVGLGAPLGLATATFMSKMAPSWLKWIMRPATDLFVGIPSVVYGWVGLVVFVPAIRENFGGSGFGLLASSLILAIMILPTMIAISEDAIRSVPRSLEEGSFALGSTRWQTLWNVVLPAAKPGILAAVILSVARAIGETMAVQMVIGNTPFLPRSLSSPTATLTSEIVVEMGNTPFGSTWNNALFMMAFLLLAVSLVLIIAIRLLGRGIRFNGRS